MASAAPTFSDLSNTTIDVTVSGGTTGLTVVANLLALASVASSSTNQAAVVNDDGTGQLRVYRWDSTSTATDDGLSVIASTDGGDGRWILQF